MAATLVRELGALAKRRREEIGLSREAFTREAGIEAEQVIRDFEHGRHLPEEDARRKLEKALDWRLESIDDVMSADRTAGTLTMEDLDAEDSLYLASVSPRLDTASDADLLAEVARRGL
ncbi:hypothetical protein [Pseudarthrobacter sp. LT1]|uniref:helix-turn-helix domain-containing protein n=1 Tax=Pseudarthrobacter sp. LT1 TaxID=3111450 RepID=UPI002D77EAB3|nr:hypothetical protein [Pseudarthrobacter sp. LT1]WRT14640.1 hypothetical protein VIK36_03870 [Pseudarthrobacter sp. LT1]